MKQRLKTYVLLLGLLFGLSTVGFVATPVGAVNPFDGACGGSNGDATICKAKSESINPLIQTIINTLLFAIGSVSVIMIIVGGIRYVISDGDSSRIKSAKDTILYAVIGLVVALLAFVIVGFVVDRFK